MVYTLSEKGKAFIRKEEGFKTEAYKDVRGIPTIGIGFTEVNGVPVKMGDKLTAEQVDKLFLAISAQYEAAVNNALKVIIEQYQYDALVSICYNIGSWGLTTSSFMKYLNAGNLVAAGVCILKWHKPYEILDRRGREAMLFATGDYEAKFP